MIGTDENELTPTPFYLTWLDEIGDDLIRQLDMWEACGDVELVERCGLSSISRAEQCEIMEAIESNLHPIKTISRYSPSSYAIKHAAEDWVGFYVSELQARTVLHILGYRSTVTDAHPRYNVSLKAWHKFKEESFNRYMADKHDKVCMTA